MRLGIDFGTTRIVVAAVDRGNYPVVAFEVSDGTAREWFPPLIAVRGEEQLYGWDAWRVQGHPEWTVTRSIKRLLEDAGPSTVVTLGDTSLPMIEILTSMAVALKQALVENSTLRMNPGEQFEVMLGVPANANSNQRFLTVEPFQRAGFSVLGLLNEPAAASIEYGHKNLKSGTAEQVLIYDLGGGTFDASLVKVDGPEHIVAASEGVPGIGGDDFDVILAELACEALGIGLDELSQSELFRLYEECRSRKESLHPNTRRMAIDFGLVRQGLEEVTVSAADFYSRCEPVIQRTLGTTQSLLDEHDEGKRLDVLYVTGGGSELPLISRSLREVFGRRVKRSAYTRSATAIGLAIQADATSGYTLKETFTRHFGVWREADSGSFVSFDVLFPKGTPLPLQAEAPSLTERVYIPVHNVGHFRYIECSHLSMSGIPTGDITVWDEVFFPFDPRLSDRTDLERVPVRRSLSMDSATVSERYSCLPNGTVEVQISNVSQGYSRVYRLGKWSGKEEPVVPGRRKKAKAAARESSSIES